MSIFFYSIGNSIGSPQVPPILLGRVPSLGYESYEKEDANEGFPPWNDIGQYNAPQLSAAIIDWGDRLNFKISCLCVSRIGRLLRFQYCNVVHWLDPPKHVLEGAFVRSSRSSSALLSFLELGQCWSCVVAEVLRKS